MLPTSVSSFQYISCYCLSSLRRIFQVPRQNFNTSHVTVYRIGTHPKAKGCKFQYISCYCLSRGDDNKNTIREIFQYISCYCLSDLQIFLLHCLRNFNTSHVTVYRFPPGFTISVNRYFNTSHVTVYHSGLDFACDFPLFQYISCYCLSCHLSRL